MQIPALTDSDQLLQEQLLADQLLSSAQLKKALAVRTQAWDDALDELSGTLCTIRPGTLKLSAFPSGKVYAEIPLQSSPEAAWGDQLVFVDPEDGRLIQTAPAPAEAGLLVTADGSFWFCDTPTELPCLGETLQVHGLGAADHDLTVSPKGDLLFVSERGAGRLHVVSLVTRRLLNTQQIRPPGARTAINVAADHQRAYITDQQSSKLWILEQGSWQLRPLQTGLGPLGNLALAPDPRFLFLSVLGSEFGMVYFDLQSLSVLQEIELEGEPASQLPNGPPTELMCLAPDAKRLLFASQARDADAEWMLVHVIRTRQVRTVRRYPISDGAKPVALLPGFTNPLWALQRKSLADWLIELGLCQAETLARLKQRLNPTVVPVNRPAPISYRAPDPDEDAAQLLMRPAPPITLPPEADEVLVEMVVRAFYQQSQKNLRQAPAEIQRLYQRAIDWRQTLEQRYAVAALAEKLLGQYTLQLLITREALLTEVDQRLEGRELPWRPSHRCPICQASMQAARHCGQCGFHLEDPQWQQRREKLSAESGSELIPGQILLALPQVGQVLLLNAWHEVISEYELSPIGLKNPCHALALPNRNYLICDARAKRVIELSPGGHLVRELKYPFTQPVLATFYATDTDSHRLLVVDRGAHSVLEFSFEGELNCRWGPKEGLDLKYPQDVQRSWNDTLLITDTGQRRVIEIERSGRILASWGPPGQPLQRPVLARREVNGDTLIVDAGRGQLTAFNEARQLVRNFSYWPPPALDGKLKDEPAPDRLLVLGRELLALSPNYWMQIAVHLEQIRWVKPWTGERKRQRLLRIGDASGESGTVALLRRVPFLKQAKREVLELLAEHLKPLGCEAGAMLLHQDELGSDMFFLAEGEVEVLKQGSDKPVATLGPGNLFGEVALILSEPRSASVRAKVNCRLLQLERKDFQQVVTSFPEFAEHLRRLALERKALTHGQRSQQQQEVLRRVKTRMAINKLRPLAFFTDASEPLLEALADAMRPVAFMPNHIFFSSGESGETMFFITRGQVFVSLADSTQPVATLQAGDVFGEMALLLDQPRSATVRGDSYCQCYALDRGTFEHIAGQHPAFFERLQKLAAQRKALNQDISSRLQAEAEAAQAAAAELQAAYAEAAAELDAALAGAEVIGSAPLMVVHLLSPVSEQILALDGEGQILRRMGQELGLFHPYRLHAQADTLWVTDTGNDRVLALDTDSGRLLREWGNHLLPLAQPRSAVPTPDGNLLIADEGNQRLVLAGPQGNFFWEYTTPHEIMSPYYAEQTPTGTFLFCDTALHMVIEIDPRNKEVIWSYGQLLIAGDGPDELSEPSCVRRLPLGGTLIADTGNDRLLLLSPQGKLMRAFVGSPEIPLIQPVQCEMLPSGEVLVWSGARAEIVRLNLAGDPVWRARMPAERVGA